MSETYINLPMTTPEQRRRNGAAGNAQQKRSREARIARLRQLVVDSPDITIDRAAGILGVSPRMVIQYTRAAADAGDPIPIRGDRVADPPPQVRCAGCRAPFAGDRGTCPHCGTAR